MMHRHRFGLHTRVARPISAILLAVLLLFSTSLQAVDVAIPQLGSSSSSLITERQEYELGQQVLKAYRAQLPTSDDPVLYNYLENLIADLAQHSELNDKSFDLLVIENSSMNAFAVPGRVIGVHTGLFLSTESEDQLASVITHEFAHLSQRHYARRLEAQKEAALPTMAGILAGIILAATAGGDAGMAALSAAQAASLDHQLRFSRQFEQEADRIGIQNLAKAGRNPAAAGQMFEAMLDATRYSQRPPEFLLTHPVTESRITDANARAMRYPTQHYDNPLAFHLVSARVRFKNRSTPQEAVKMFTSELEGTAINREASEYGLALALTATGDTKLARQRVQSLIEKRPDELLYHIALAQVEAKEQKFDNAIQRLQTLLAQSPKNHPLNVTLAEVLMAAGRYSDCETLLERFVTVRPDDHYVWYLLSEVHGLTGNILELHFSRAEYFVLNGVYDAALKQLENALKLTQGDLIQTARTREKIKSVRELQEQLENL